MAARSLPSGDDADGDGIVAEINITPLLDLAFVLLIGTAPVPNTIAFGGVPTGIMKP